jgi:hypothetical protein
VTIGASGSEAQAARTRASRQMINERVMSPFLRKQVANEPIRRARTEIRTPNLPHSGAGCTGVGHIRLREYSQKRVIRRVG